MTNKNEYSSSHIHQVSFPPWILGANGLMSRTWHITLRGRAAEGLEAWKASEPSLEVGVELAAGGDLRQLLVTTTAHIDPMSDEAFYWATYRVFVAIDTELGLIESIQGSARSHWFPFRGIEGS